MISQKQAKICTCNRLAFGNQYTKTAKNDQPLYSSHQGYDQGQDKFVKIFFKMQMFNSYGSNMQKGIQDFNSTLDANSQHEGIDKTVAKSLTSRLKPIFYYILCQGQQTQLVKGWLWPRLFLQKTTWIIIC